MIYELFQSTKLTPQEQTIIRYIQEHPESIIHDNAKELSKKTNVSSPTIIRLTKKLGFKGYLDFQLQYVQEYYLQKNNQAPILTPNSSIDEIIQALPEIYNQVFLETKQMIRKESFVRTINYMLQAKQIDFYANDNNYSEVQSVCLKLSTLGIHTQSFNTLNQHYIETSNPQDILSFVVSHSGKNQTMVDVAYYLRKKRFRVIALTGKLDPTLELICNESLYIDSSMHQLPFGIMLYGLSIHYLLDILITTLMVKKKQIK